MNSPVAPPRIDSAPEIREDPVVRRSRPFGAFIAIAAIVCGLVGGRIADTDAVDGYGLLNALGPVYWAGVALAVLGTALLLRQALSVWTPAVGLVPASWLAVLHTGPHLAHDHLRFPTNWTHIGFMRVIQETGTGDVFIDARFAWPGFFGIFVAPFGELDQGLLELVLRLWPTIILAATGILIGSLASRAYPRTPIVEPLAATCYFLLAWTGQDYWSPQSVSFTIYLAMLVLIESGPLRTSPAWSASVPFLARFAAAGGDRPRSRNPAVFAALTILGIAAVVSHPLAPFFICCGLLMLGVYGRGVGWRVIAIVAVAFVVWFIVMAQPWYATQLAAMVDELGSLFSNLDDTTGARVATSSPEHLFVTQVRTVVGISTILLVFVIGIAMAFDRFKHLRPVIPLAPLAGAPSLALALGSYGGEIVFRVILFLLPLASILFARTLLAVSRRWTPLVMAVCALAMTVPLLVARFGNEAFEMTNEVDRAVMDAVIERADDDALILLENGFVASGDRTIGRNQLFSFPVYIDGEPVELTINDEIIDLAFENADQRGLERVIFVVTPSMHQWREHGMSSPPDFLDEFADWLKSKPGSTVLFDRDDGFAIELRNKPVPPAPVYENGIPLWLIQLTGIFALLFPFLAYGFNLGKVGGSSVPNVLQPGEQQRWRLEFYSTSPDVHRTVIVDEDIPFPVKRVRSARGELALSSPADRKWTLPQLELDITAEDPFDSATLAGLFGGEHIVRFVTGDEAMVQTEDGVLIRARAVAFRA